MPARLSGEDGRTLHYGEGRLAGKRAMVVVTCGASDVSLGPRGINGSLDDLLWSLQHGTFFYTGMSTLPPFAVYGADRVPNEQFVEARDALRERLRTLETTEPFPFRARHGGDYDEDMVLVDGVAAGRAGYAIHHG